MLMQDKKITGRKKRMEHFKSMHGRSSLNLVSLMDIFTILVFFLLVNTGAQELPSSKDIKLPTSVASKAPQENLIIAITRDHVLVGGRAVADINMILQQKESVVDPLIAELKYHAGRKLISEDDSVRTNSVTILGDENTPYDLISKILASCRQANYTHISFAAFQTAKSKI